MISPYMSSTSTSSANTTTVSRWAPGPAGLMVWQNISLEYTLSIISGQNHLTNVRIIDSFYTGLTIALSRTHQFGSFSGRAFLGGSVITVPSGTASATGLDLYGVNILGVPAGLRVQRTFNIEFRP